DSKVDAPALVAAGMQAEERNDVPLAESFYRKALAIEKGQPIALNNLSSLLIARGGDTNEAVKLAKRAVEIDPKQATYRDSLAMAQSKAGQVIAASQVMRIAVGLEPDNAMWRVRLAQYQLDSGDLAEAGRTIDSLAKMDLRPLSQDMQDQLK